MEEITHKKCCACKQTKPLSNFTKNKAKTYGVASECRECRALYRKRAKDTINKTKREYYRTRYTKRPKVKDTMNERAYIRYAVQNLSKFEDDCMLDSVGCTAKQLANHLQQSAINNGYTGFDVYNYDSSVYHIDHIKPFKMYINGDADITEITHYTNTQILKERDNLLKGESY